MNFNFRFVHKYLLLRLSSNCRPYYINYSSATAWQTLRSDNASKYFLYSRLHIFLATTSLIFVGNYCQTRRTAAESRARALQALWFTIYNDYYYYYFPSRYQENAPALSPISIRTYRISRLISNRGESTRAGGSVPEAEGVV
jgi:hypothetical protein